ncbi:glycosyltransferase [Mycolicibacterium vaccae]|uniref:glycosyltransferase n=1 Tax=Mycolicibacterium vaccae TaxID=1810 RepID=UPI003D04F09F
MNKSVAIIGTRGYPSYYGGFETLVRRLAPALSERGWAVTVYGRPGTVRRHDDERDPRVLSITTAGVETKSLSTLSYGLTSAWHASRHRPSVALVVNVANGFWLPLLKRRGVPTVVNVDGIEWERAKWGPAAKQAFMYGAQMTARYADHLVFDSLEIARRWEAGFCRDGQFISYGGTEPVVSEPDGRFPPHRYALMVARFVPENTVAEFLCAAERLSQRHHVVIVGSSGYGGVLDDTARRLAQGNERIHWLGHVSDDTKLFSLWQRAGVYFHGHSVGGTNPALVQAMACGAPTVARDTVYNREVLGEAGRYVDPHPDKIAAALEEVLDDASVQARMGSAARTRQQTCYTWELVCSRYSEALDAARVGRRDRALVPA